MALVIMSHRESVLGKVGGLADIQHKVQGNELEQVVSYNFSTISVFLYVYLFCKSCVCTYIEVCVYQSVCLYVCVCKFVCYCVLCTRYPTV